MAEHNGRTGPAATYATPRRPARRGVARVVMAVCLAVTGTAAVQRQHVETSRSEPIQYTEVPTATRSGPGPIAELEVTDVSPLDTRWRSLVRGALADAGVSDGTVTSPDDVVRVVATRPRVASWLAAQQPRRSSPIAVEARLAAALGPMLVPAGARAGDVRRAAVRRLFTDLPRPDRDWLAVLFPSVVGNLPGAPFAQRILANRVRVAAALADTNAMPVAAARGEPGWWPTDRGEPALRTKRAATFRKILAEDRQLLYFDPEAASGRGSWVELVGEVGPRTTAVGILVPGGSAYVTSDNFDRYRNRAASFVGAADGSLAMIVWAAGEFPSGWVAEAVTAHDARLAHKLVAFARELRVAIADAGSVATVTAIGHSYGGAVIGAAERQGLSVDRVLHLASAGVGVGVRRASDYPVPDRPRYSMTAPGDWISYVQGLPGPLDVGLGHGADPDETPGFVALDAGTLPADPASPDEFGGPIGPRAGTPIAGRAGHSTIFIRYSDAWWNIYHVLVGGRLRLLPGTDRYAAPAAPASHLPFAPLPGATARCCHQRATRHDAPGRRRRPGAPAGRL